jgi:hypothetical protein
MSYEQNPVLSHVKTLLIPATDGQVTIAKDTKVFSQIDPDFKDWGLDTVSQATTERLVDIYEVSVGASYKKTFSSKVASLNKQALTQNQITVFCKTYTEELLDGVTIFLFKKIRWLFFKRFFVARVDVRCGRLSVRVHSLGSERRCDGGRHRVVVPQL